MVWRALSFSIIFFAAPAYAIQQWEVDKEHSRIRFYAQQGGEQFSGSLPKYDATIAFDPDDLWGSSIEFTFNIAAITVQGEDRQAEITGEQWLDVTRYAQAHFKSTDIRQEDEGYVAYGALTLRGITKDVAVKFTLTPRGTDMIAKGSAIINRRDFFVGTGEFASDQWVAYPVKIKFNLLTLPKQKPAEE